MSLSRTYLGPEHILDHQAVKMLCSCHIKACSLQFHDHFEFLYPSQFFICSYFMLVNVGAEACHGQ